MEKIRVSFSKILKIALISFAIGLVIIAGFMITSLIKWPWETFVYIVFGGYFLLCVALLIIGVVFNYYVIENSALLVRRFNKEFYIDYKNIIYIDEEISLKKKSINLVTKDKKTLYLPFDKKGVVYEEMLKRCKNRLSKQEFRQKYPDIKL